VSRDILAMLPEELKNLHFESELAEVERRLALDKKAAGVMDSIDLELSLRELERDPALRATKRSSARPAARTDASAAFTDRQLRRWTAVVPT
jgi:hypothetical protein